MSKEEDALSTKKRFFCNRNRAKKKEKKDLGFLLNRRQVLPKGTQIRRGTMCKKKGLKKTEDTDTKLRGVLRTQKFRVDLGLDEGKKRDPWGKRDRRKKERGESHG